jgi:hypothetical protein
VPAGVSPSEAGEAPALATADLKEPEPPTTGPAFKSAKLPVGAINATAGRTDIEFHDVDHAGPSYEGRVYINHPDADESTGYDHPSYAGSYHVFGHGGCLGDPGHCDVEPRRKYDPRPAHPLTRARKVVIANESARNLLHAADEVTVTVVPIVEPLPYKNVEKKLVEDPLDIGYVQVVSYR